MEFRQLQYFLAVAEEGQITKAAKRLHLTQPPLSQQLILLEKELGVQLLERSKKQIRLTEAGRILQKRALQMFDLRRSLENELQEAIHGLNGRLTIGTVTSTGTTLLPERIQQFHQQYPKVTFHLRQEETHTILDLLGAGLIDLGIVRLPFNTEGLEWIQLPDESMVAASLCRDDVMPPAPMPLAALQEQPLLIHQRHLDMLRDACLTQGFEPNVLCSSNDIAPLLVWAGRGLGIAVLPDSARNLFPAAPLQFQPIVQPVIRTTSAVVWSKKRPLSLAAAHFISLFP